MLAVSSLVHWESSRYGIADPVLYFHLFLAAREWLADVAKVVPWVPRLSRLGRCLVARQGVVWLGQVIAVYQNLYHLKEYLWKEASFDPTPWEGRVGALSGLDEEERREEVSRISGELVPHLLRDNENRLEGVFNTLLPYLETCGEEGEDQESVLMFLAGRGWRNADFARVTEALGWMDLTHTFETQYDRRNLYRPLILKIASAGLWHKGDLATCLELGTKEEQVQWLIQRLGVVSSTHASRAYWCAVAYRVFCFACDIGVVYEWGWRSFLTSNFMAVIFHAGSPTQRPCDAFVEGPWWRRCQWLARHPSPLSSILSRLMVMVRDREFVPDVVRVWKGEELLVSTAVRVVQEIARRAWAVVF